MDGNTPTACRFIMILFMSFSFCQLSIAQSSFDLNDPNIIYKDIDGHVMTKDSLMSFVARGSFNIERKNLGNGITEIVLYRKNDEQRAKDQEVTTSWSRSWIGKSFPNFEFTTLGGTRIKRSDLNGKISVINFWFTGCQPCIQEMPALNEVVRTYDKQAINFLAFSLDDEHKTRKFLKKHRFRYKQISGARSLIKEMGVSTYPTHIILDKDGVIREIEVGAYEDTQERIRRLVENVRNP